MVLTSDCHKIQLKTVWRAVGKNMTLKVDHISAFLDQQAPPTTKLDFDNIGLLLGSPSATVSSVLCVLDVTPEVIEEAKTQKADLIVAHHPLIFKKLSRINPSTEEGWMISELLKHDIAVFAAHTNYDLANDGVSFIMADKLGLSETEFLDPLQDHDCLLEVTSNPAYAREIQNLLHQYGDSIAYSSSAAGEAHFKVTAQQYMVRDLQKALSEIDEQCRSWSYPVKQDEAAHGLGVVGFLDEPVKPYKFLQQVKKTFNCEYVAYSGNPDTIERVALCGGAGAPLISKALAKADAYITADLKYHDYFTGTPDFLLADIGHYESEIPSVDELADRLRRRFEDLNVQVTSVNTNPINHL